MGGIVMNRLALAGSALCLMTFVALAQGPGARPGARPHGQYQPGSGNPTFGMLLAPPGSGTVVTGAPYSAVQSTEFQQSLDGGNQIARHLEAKVYRDGQGRVRIERTAGR